MVEIYLWDTYVGHREVFEILSTTRNIGEKPPVLTQGCKLQKRLDDPLSHQKDNTLIMFHNHPSTVNVASLIYCN